MKRLWNKAGVLALALILACGFAGCANGYSDKGYTPPHTQSGDTLHFSASDSAFAEFLNDYAHRHLRYDDYAVADVTADGFGLGSGSGFAKNWETMGLIWHNSTGFALGSDKHMLIKTFLQSITQDGMGMVYNSHNTFLAGMDKVGANMPQGWPIPNSSMSQGKSQAFEFNDASEDAGGRVWHITQGGSKSLSNGYLNFSYTGDAPLRIYRRGITIDAHHAPIADIELCYVDMDHAIGTGSNVADVSVIFQTEEGGDTWFKAPQSLYATTPQELTYAYAARSYFSMYLHPDWVGKTVTAIGIEIEPALGETLHIRNGRMNYIHPDYDTRQSNGTYQWLLALGNYIAATGDVRFLQDMLPKARRAILFLTHVLGGENGLLDIGYFYGHDGTGYPEDKGQAGRSPADGIGNGYWDILSTPAINLEANVYYYQALRTMANLERRAEQAGITCGETFIRNRAVGEPNVPYVYTAQALDGLASVVKTNIEKDIAPVKGDDGKWRNAGGFYNPLTARFACGVRPNATGATASVIDNGYIMWNQEALAAGLGTARQRKRIMEWINGDRTVEGDDVTGDSIYLYEFGPRTSTKQNDLDWSGFYDGTTVWEESVQNGGAVMCWSYYDLMSRLQIFGADDMYERFSEICKWYNKVVDAGGEGNSFYSTYYNGVYNYLRSKPDNPDYRPYVQLPDGLPDNYNPDAFVLQQNTGTNGAVGLDAEFLESIMLIAAVPYGMFGMDGNTHNVLQFTNNLPAKLRYMQIDNMLYGGTFKYSVRMEKGVLEICNAMGSVPADARLTLRLPKPSGAFTVTANGKKVDHTFDGDYVAVTVPMGNVRVSIS